MCGVRVCCLCEAMVVHHHHCTKTLLGYGAVYIRLCPSRVAHLCCDPSRAYECSHVCEGARLWA